MVAPSSIEGDAGETTTRSTGGGGGSVTVNFTALDTPSTSAVIAVIPVFFAVASPDVLMVATDVLLLVQVKVLPGIFMLSASKAEAENCCVSPSSIDTADGPTVTVATSGSGGGVGSVTVIFTALDMPSTSAVIAVVPAFFAVASPDVLMVATDVLLLVQVKVLPGIFMLSASKAEAENCCVSPSSIDTADGPTVTVATTGSGGGAAATVAVKSCVAVRPPGSLAVTTILPVVPAATGVIVTVLPDMLTVTIDGFGELTV